MKTSVSKPSIKSRALISAILIFLMLVIGILLVYKIFNSIKEKQKNTEHIQKLPQLDLTETNGSVFSTNSIDFNSNKIVLNFFRSDCDHCQNLAKKLNESLLPFKNTFWLMITNEDYVTAKQFSDHYDLTGKSSIKILSDTLMISHKHFNVTKIPSFFVYREGKLSKIFLGECKVSYLLR